jgi:hypothetical protein
VADDDRGRHWPAAALGQQLRAVSFDQRLDLGEQRCFLAVDLADPLEDRSGNPDLWAARQSREPSGDLRSNPWADQTLRSDLGFELGSDLHDMPPQPADQTDAFVDQLIAVIGQDPDLERLLIEERDRQRVDPFPERGASDRGRVDRIGLPRLAHRPPRALREPGRHPDHPITARDQPALQATRHVPAVLDRPHPLAIELGREPQRLKRPVV